MTSSGSGRRGRRRRRPMPSASARPPTRTFSARRSRSSSPGGVGRIPISLADDLPPSWISTNQRLRDVGSIGGVNRQLCDPAPAGSLRRLDRTRQPRRVPVRREGGRGLARPARPAWSSPRTARATRPSRSSSFRAGRSPISTARASAPRPPDPGGVVTVRFTRDSLEVPTTWAGVPTSFSAGGLTPFGHALKPDVMAPGAQILSSTLEEFAGRQVRDPRRDELLGAARRRSRRRC